jgi:membrane-associated phospholipid phosphatase
MKRPLALRGLIGQNTLYFTAFALFLIIGGILLLCIETGEDIFFFSARRSSLGDAFFRYVTKMGEAPIYLLAIAVLLFVRYRYALSVPLLGFIVTFVSYWSKQYFRHDRPLPYLSKLGTFDQLNLVEGVTVHSGSNGFPSGHAMSAFAICTFLALCLPYKRRLALPLFALALLVGLSRIYLVQHFLKDVYLGAVLGVLLAMGWYYLQSLPKKAWLDGRLGGRRHSHQV